MTGSPVNKARGDITEDNIWVTIVIWVIVGLINLAAMLVNENNPFTKCCCKFGGFLGITNRASFVSRTSRPRRYWAWDLLDARHLVTGFVPPAMVFVYRLLGVVYFVFVMIWKAVGPLELASRYGHTGKWITFFTNWTFVGFAAYAVLGCIITLKELRSRSKRWETESKSQSFTFWDKAYLLVLEAVGTAAITLTAFYWFAIYDGKRIKVDNVMVHGGNVVYILLDIFITRTPIVTYHFQAAVMYGTAYMVYMWITFGIAGYFRYPALNGTRSSSVGFYVALFVLLLISFTILYLVAGLREWIMTGKFCCTCRCNDEEEGIVTTEMASAPQQHAERIKGRV